jgi:hypothetical protein
MLPTHATGSSSRKKEDPIAERIDRAILVLTVSQGDASLYLRSDFYVVSFTIDLKASFSAMGRKNHRFVYPIVDTDRDAPESARLT